MTFEDLRLALEIFGLPERATLGEIKARHRELAKCHHPDSGAEPDPERMKKIGAAHRILMDYCSAYRFSFSREEFLEQNPEERLREQFAPDTYWRG